MTKLKFFSPLAVLVLLAACAQDPQIDEDATAGGGAQTTATTGSAGQQTTATAPAGPEAGSRSDFVQNVGDRVFFDFDSSSLTGEARSTLNAQARFLNRFSQYTIVIEGHADERGTREYNLALGERRANAARNYLIAQGVAPNRIRTVSFGKERPAVVGSNESAWAQNRRSVTVLQ